ncbi:MAG: endonuclease/exonuclease/phosphatase family protein [Pseudomonadales bacterium]
MLLIALAGLSSVALATPEAPTVDAAASLRVLTLNVAHGRKDGPNQLLQSTVQLRKNLGSIGDLFTEREPDVVALQEADGPSRWSGGFDHVRLLADRGNFPWRFRGDHAEGWLARYGTALLSRMPFQATQSLKFAPTLPTPTKGFVIGELPWPGGQPASLPGQVPDKVDVVSVHLDYLSTAARERQVDDLARVLARRANPVIVLGDFNSNWDDPNSAVKRLAEDAGLASYEPEAAALPTFGDRRLDWILISPEFRFRSYQVLPEVVSDHQAVMADIGLAAE